MATDATKVRYSPISVKQATFKAGLAAQVHRWFRLTPSFGPDLVQEMLAVMGCREDEVVLDPFSGVGTTLIEAQLDGLTGYGYEINPLLHFVCETSLNWAIDPDDLASDLADVEAEFNALKRPDLTLQDVGVPPIHNPARWWRQDVLIDLQILKAAIDCASTSIERRDFLRLALAGVLVPDLTNVTLGRLQLHFIDRTADPMDVWGSFDAHVRLMMEDLRDLARLPVEVPSRIWNTDAVNPAHEIPAHSVGCVITSPPYPNRYSYVWNTRPHLFMLDFFTKSSEAGALDKATIGGTWGVATSHIANGVLEPANEVVERVVGGLTSEIRVADNLMANYVMKYFNLLADQISAMRGVLADDARLAYVVGCSRIKGTFVETDVLLADIIAGLDLGFEITDIHRMRKRNSGVDLHESIVYAAR